MNFLVGALALHAGFQLTVTALVYPALARVRASGWAVAHRSHSRRIAPLVAVVYLVALAGCAGELALGHPSGAVLVAVLVAVAATVVAMAVTAAFAAPLHRGLAKRDDG